MMWTCIHVKTKCVRYQLLLSGCDLSQNMIIMIPLTEIGFYFYDDVDNGSDGDEDDGDGSVSYTTT